MDQPPLGFRHAVEATPAPRDTKRHGRPCSLSPDPASSHSPKPGVPPGASRDPGVILHVHPQPASDHPPLHPPCPATFSCPALTRLPGKSFSPPALGRQGPPRSHPLPAESGQDMQTADPGGHEMSGPTRPAEGWSVPAMQSPAPSHQDVQIQ